MNRGSSIMDKITANKLTYRVLLAMSLLAVIPFFVLFGVMVFSNTDLDNSGMGIVVLLPIIGVCATLLYMSYVALFHNLKQGIAVNRGAVILMLLLAAPVLLIDVGWIWLLCSWIL